VPRVMRRHGTLGSSLPPAHVFDNVDVHASLPAPKLRCLAAPRGSKARGRPDQLASAARRCGRCLSCLRLAMSVNNYNLSCDMCAGHSSSGDLRPRMSTGDYTSKPRHASLCMPVNNTLLLLPNPLLSPPHHFPVPPPPPAHPPASEPSASARSSAALLPRKTTFGVDTSLLGFPPSLSFAPERS
jgi:hypothetical protein